MAESPIETKRVVRNLPVKLKDAELLEFGKRLAQSSADIHGEEERQQQVKAELKAKLGAIESERTRLAGIVSSGRENRDVSCDMILDFSRLIVEVVRLDTREVVETRRMTDGEQQRSLFTDAPPKEQAGGVESTPEQVQQIKEHLQQTRAEEKIAEVTAAIAKSDNLFLSKEDIFRMSQEDWDEIVKVAGGDTHDGPRFMAILDRAHWSGPRDGDVQCCTSCGARLDFMAAGLVEGYPEAAHVGQDCKVVNGPI